MRQARGDGRILSLRFACSLTGQSEEEGGVRLEEEDNSLLFPISHASSFPFEMEENALNSIVITHWKGR